MYMYVYKTATFDAVVMTLVLTQLSLKSFVSTLFFLALRTLTNYKHFNRLKVFSYLFKNMLNNPKISTLKLF